MVKKVVEFDLGLLDNPANVPAELLVRYPELRDDKEAFGMRIASAKVDVAKGNSAMFFAHLYTGLFGGTLKDEYEHPIRVRNGERRRFHPDVVHRGRVIALEGRGREEVYRELKAFSTRDGSCLCRINQFENYVAHFLERLEKKDRRIDFGYSFFRYKPNFVYTRMKAKYSNGFPVYKKSKHRKCLTSMNPEDSVRFLAGGARDLLVLPSNLTLFLMYGSDRTNKTRFAPSTGDFDAKKSGNYWKVASGDISRLHGGIEGITENTSFYEREQQFIAENLFLDRLVSKKISFAGTKVNGMPINPDFNATVYGFRSYDDYDSWVNHFRRNHKEILSEMGIRDLYAESEDVPI